jgi:hypothetical protein
MRKLFLLALLLLVGRAYSEENWSIVKNSPLFSLSAEFECKKGDFVEAKVIRTGRFCPRYFYDLYDSLEGFQARGITRAFSWGFLFPWGIEIDVYDGYGYMIGKIEGKLFTKARARFGFFGIKSNELAVAYLNTETADFAIVSQQDEVLADLRGEEFGDVSVWKMNFIKPCFKVDPRVLKIFAAFVADYHSEFLPPPKVISNYYFIDSSKRAP